MSNKYYFTYLLKDAQRSGVTAIGSFCLYVCVCVRQTWANYNGKCNPVVINYNSYKLP